MRRPEKATLEYMKKLRAQPSEDVEYRFADEQAELALFAQRAKNKRLRKEKKAKVVELGPASDIIRTWPAAVDAKTVYEIFRVQNRWAEYYFTLGRGKPHRKLNRIWFTWRGRILGSFKIDRVVCNDGSLPSLSRLDGGESEWQIKRDNWVAICKGSCEPLRERLYHSGFRGWRYFDLAEYRGTSESTWRQ